MNLKSTYKDDLVTLLKKYQAQDTPLATSGFFMFENLEENSLLFIGINPSPFDDDKNKEEGIYWANEKF
jgi:hypothetical protein